MRITLTVDDDVAVRLNAFRKKTGLSLENAVNVILRKGLLADKEPFKVKAGSLGKVGKDFDLEKIGQVIDKLDQLDGK